MRVYADHVRAYRAAGWPSVIPLPPREKWPPPPGVTGYAGRWPSAADHQTWADFQPDGNIALRLPPGVIAPDVDAYGNKRGAETIAALEAKWGPLPPTIMSTSRDDGVSGIRLYRVKPMPGWRDVGPDVETVHFGCRYMLVWPSVHPETGATYGWVDLRTGEIVEYPGPEDGVWLPDPWQQGLARTEAPADKDEVSHSEVAEWLRALPNGPACHATKQALKRFHADLATAGSRHNAARDRGAALIRVGEMGHHGVREAVDQAQAGFISAVAADRPGRAPAEWRRIIAGGVGLVVAKPTAQENHGCGCAPDLPPFAPGAARAAGYEDTSASSDLWDAREHLDLVRQWARARRAAPAATLVGVLTRVAAATPAFVVLPPLIGGEASLNQFALFVGLSGGGKGAADRAADTAIDLSAGTPFAELGPGSGEGVSHLFVRRVKDKLKEKLKDEIEQHTDSVLLVAPEVDTIAALMTRQASTLMAELRKGWDGAPLGFAYADPAKRLPVARHAYRLCLSVGVQPERAGIIVNDAGAGTPQRFIWVLTRDPGIPDVAPDDPPEAIKWTPPLWPRNRQPLTPMGVCAVAVAAVDAAAVARHRGQVDALDGHALLCRLKIAGAFAILDGRCDVTDEDWQLAGVVHGWSNSTRDYVLDVLAHKAQQTNTARGVSEGEREIAREQVVDGEQVKRVCNTILRKLGRVEGWVSGSDVRRGLPVKLRQHFDEAVERLAGAGQIEVEHVRVNAGPGIRLRLAGGAR